MRVVRYWNRFPREAEDAPFLWNVQNQVGPSIVSHRCCEIILKYTYQTLINSEKKKPVNNSPFKNKTKNKKNKSAVSKSLCHLTEIEVCSFFILKNLLVQPLV